MNVFLGNSLDLYAKWERPECIISDGPYGVCGYKGDEKNIQNFTRNI